MQNKGHIKWLQAFLVEQALPFYSYIVFSDRCILKDIKLTSADHYVMNRHKILSAVRQNMAKVGKRLSPQKIDDLFEKLYPFTQVDEVRKMAHIQNIQQKTQKSVLQSAPAVVETPKAEESICPRCGGKLVMRTAKKGERQGKQFLGCSNFPKCRYIEDLPIES